MNMFLKYGSVFSCMFMLAACEVPGGAQNVYDEDGSRGGASGSTPYEGSYGSAASSTAAEFEENVGDRVFFDLNSSVLSEQGRMTLERQASWLNQYSDIAIRVEGHADERGTREYNLALGERRANAAKDVLIASGVSPRRISVVSYGKERPAVMGHSEQAWSQNRRSVTVLAQ